MADWNITASADEKSSTGYVGLKNLGCTCYMNSLLHQFYMIPEIREGILAIPDNELQKNEESVLFQLKAIFGSLKASDRKFHNPKDFTSIFRNYSNQVMNVLEQMDVDEFFNLLLDRLEPYITGTQHKDLFKSNFTGQTSNELICKGCPHYSERLEDFSSVCLQVKTKKNVIESLNAFVQGEMLEGDNAYYCEKCDKKVNTLKRQSIKKLPQTLVLVLKRFEYNYDTMQKIKVNDYCEFPFELDMEPFTKEGIHKKEAQESKKTQQTTETEGEGNDNEQMDVEVIQTEEEDVNKGSYKYDLTGVIIHMGTADSGHYYSLVKPENKSWLEINDTHVTEYDIADLAEDAFGGSSTTATNLTSTLGIKDKTAGLSERGSNAYVLFYTRKQQPDTENTEKMQIDDQSLDRTQAISEIASNLNLSESKSVKHSNIQPNIMELIRNDNYQYSVSKILFSSEYFNFIQDLAVNYNTETNSIFTQPMITKNDNTDIFPSSRRIVDNLNIPERLFVKNLQTSKQNDEVITSEEMRHYIFKLAATVFFSANIRCKDRTNLPAFVDILKTNINLSTMNAEWLLEEFSNSETISEFLVDCPLADMRKTTCGLLYCAMIKIFKTNNVSFEEQNNNLLNFINTVIHFIVRKGKFITKDFTFLYQVLWRFSLLGPQAKMYLQDNNILKYILFFFQSKEQQPGVSNSSNLEELVPLKLREVKHKDLKTMYNKREKLSNFEELFEKKQRDKQSTPTDIYLLMTLCEVLKNSDVNPYIDNSFQPGLALSESNKLLFNFGDSGFIKTLISEARTRQAVLCLSKLLNYVAYNNQEVSLCIGAVLIEFISFLDSFEIIHVLRLFKHFVLMDDSLSSSRVTFYLNFLF